VEAAPLVEGPLRADLTLLLPPFPADPFLEVLWPILRVDAMAMRRVGLLPGALHIYRAAESLELFCVGFGFAYTR
jgi:hypothetical protein